jgi:hypothetical protein
MATGYSLDLHNLIGSHRKQQRIHYLKNYWMDRVKDVPDVFFRTSQDPRYSCAITIRQVGRSYRRSENSFVFVDTISARERR